MRARAKLIEAGSRCCCNIVANMSGACRSTYHEDAAFLSTPPAAALSMSGYNVAYFTAPEIVVYFNCQRAQSPDKSPKSELV